MLGNAHNKAPNSGTCAAPDMSVPATPNGNATNIAAFQQAVRGAAVVIPLSDRLMEFDGQGACTKGC